MASKEKLPAWIQENVPDDAVWSEYYLVARKEETQSGNRVHINQTLKTYTHLLESSDQNMMDKLNYLRKMSHEVSHENEKALELGLL